MDEQFKDEVLVLLTSIERWLCRLNDAESEDGDAIDQHVSLIRESLKDKWEKCEGSLSPP